jgi:hypothetical protein
MLRNISITTDTMVCLQNQRIYAGVHKIGVIFDDLKEQDRDPTTCLQHVCRDTYPKSVVDLMEETAVEYDIVVIYEILLRYGRSGMKCYTVLICFPDIQGETLFRIGVGVVC